MIFIYIYFFIFISKILENTLSTLRIIVVANGRKKLGAFLQGVVALIWIFVTGVVIVDVSKDFFKVIFFCLGTIIGSYMGSLLEEKVALGENLLICKIDKKFYKTIKNKLTKTHTIFYNFKDNNSYLFFICLKRKNFKRTHELFKLLNKNSYIIVQNTKNSLM